MANLIDQGIVDAIVNTPTFITALKGLSQDTLLGVERILNDAFNQGLGIRYIVDKIRNILDISYRKTQAVIRTESHRLTEIAHNQEFLDAQAQGIDTKMKLLSTLDDRTRPQSAQMDGKISDNEGKFTYPNQNRYIPGDPAMPARWAINDRERSIQIIDDISPEIRRSREDGIIPFQNFETWAKSKGLEYNAYGQKLFP